MTDHDPMCPCKTDPTGYVAGLCRCTLIREVRANQDIISRANERERIAGGMKAEADDFRRAVLKKERERIARAMYQAMADRIEVDGTQYIAVTDAAWIALNGGRDEYST